MEWQPIETAPKDGREQILLKVPYNQEGVLAWSNTWWISGFSAENKPTHWKLATPSNEAVEKSSPHDAGSERSDQAMVILMKEGTHGSLQNDRHQPAFSCCRS